MVVTPPTPEERTADRGVDPDPAGESAPPRAAATWVPALVVLGLAVTLATVGIVASLVASGSAPKYHVRSVTLPDGSRVAMSPAATALSDIVADGQPPADIIGNLGVPSLSTPIRATSTDQGAAQFDRTVALTSPLSPRTLLSAFRVALPLTGWQVIYSGTAPQGTPGTAEVLAKRGSGDGFYWEVGIVASPITEAGITPFTVEVLQLPDGN